MLALNGLDDRAIRVAASSFLIDGFSPDVCKKLLRYVFVPA
jgi:hypothetical protein